MFDEGLAGLRAHRQSIDQYRRLLQTHLTALERGFIERRIVEEQAQLDRLAFEMIPIIVSRASKAGLELLSRDAQ